MVIGEGAFTLEDEAIHTTNKAAVDPIVIVLVYKGKYAGNLHFQLAM
jgi:hypothetical protein